MTYSDTPLALPPSIKPYFQEYDFSRLAVDIHAELVIERVLNYGNLEELRWLFTQYGWSPITQWVQERGEKRLSSRRYRLWCVLLEIPPSLFPSTRKTPLWTY